MFVILPNLVEWLFRYEDMDDFYVYDESTFSIYGQRSNKVYRLGDDIRVKVKSASREKHTAIFVVVNKKYFLFDGYLTI